jgi:dehydrogenase/reductase SDR family member 4
VTPETGPVLDTSEKAWDKIFDVNVKSSYLLAKEVLPFLRKRGGGSIVFVSSIVAYQPMAVLGAYSVSKTTLLGLTKAASIDLAPENIRVNCLVPGIIETKFSAIVSFASNCYPNHWLICFLFQFYESETAKEAALATVPMGRLGQPEEMAGVVAFLVSDDATYITGETITAAGGMPSRLWDQNFDRNIRRL